MNIQNILSIMLLGLLGIWQCFPATAANNVIIYPAPSEVAINRDFTIQVRALGEIEWQNVASYLVKVDEIRGTVHHVENASMASFDFSGTAEVKIVYNKGKIKEARVRPLSYDIIPEVEDSIMTFSIDSPHNLSVEVNGDIFHNLHLFANPIDSFIPDIKKDSNLIYLGPGVHRFENNEFKIPSGKTVYLAGGAVAMGRMVIENAQNVRLLGRGVIDCSVKMGIRISHSRNVLVEGVFTTQCATGGSDNVTIRNVKSISYYGWGDGMNVFASNNVLFDGVFCRNSDDCTTVYGTRKGYEGGCSNITMQNSVLWADVAHPIFIDIHGNSQKPEILENLNYQNIDILDHNEKQINYQGCLAINAGDNNLVRNVRFENIRVENFRLGQLINLRIFYNKKYCTAPGRGIENVLFKDISYVGNRSLISIIEGYNEDRKIRNIRFENLRINGELIADDMPGKPKWYNTGDMANIYVGPHVDGVTFINGNNGR